jgi:hypothetical protein
MTYLCIIFISPLYFLTRKKWGGFVLNSILYGIACLCVLSMVGIVIAPIFWFLAVGHAAFAHRREAMEEHATVIATKIAEKMRQAPPAMPPKP